MPLSNLKTQKCYKILTTMLYFMSCHMYLQYARYANIVTPKEYIYECYPIYCLYIYHMSEHDIIWVSYAHNMEYDIIYRYNILVFFSWYNINMLHYENHCHIYCSARVASHPKIKQFRRNVKETSQNWNLRICLVVIIYHPFLPN